VGDALLVRRGHRVRERDGEREEPVESESLLGKNLGEGFPFHPLHGDEVNAVGFLDRVHRHDVGVIESGDGFGLALETGAPLGACGELGREDFQSDFAIELRVLREIDLAHAALSQLLDDAVVRELSADHGVTSMTQRSATSSSQWK